MAKHRYNFNPGPAVLPEPVLAKAAEALRELPGAGLSVAEISHRGPEYRAINQEAQERFARLAGLEGSHKILFLQGGASLQFMMVPLNLMPEGGKADYVVTGSWAKKALDEANRRGTGQVAATTESEKFARIPRTSELQLDSDAAYLHYTSNNTIFGTQWPDLPVAAVPLVVDASSDILSRRLDYDRHGLIYAGAQKNLGPAGVTVVAIREDLLSRSGPDLPPMLSYAIQAEKASLYNTPPVLGVYMVGLVLEWIDEAGGLEAVESQNRRKSEALYGVIDASDFYRGTAAPESRSMMNVTFRLPSEKLEKRFLEKALAEGFAGLKGHRSVGGCRASLYNAFPLEGTTALASFMKEFERKNG